MGADVMGRVVVEATVENLGDLYMVDRGHASLSEVRRIVIPDALVDMGATTLALPKSAISELGLKKAFERESRSSQGLVRYSVYGPVRLTVQGRNCVAEVVEVPDDVPALIGQVPIELMDWVVDPKNQRLIGNPAHGGVQTIELY